LGRAQFVAFIALCFLAPFYMLIAPSHIAAIYGFIATNPNFRTFVRPRADVRCASDVHLKLCQKRLADPYTAARGK
jgi:hypothetical protein